jgi:general secretion pathway protein A
LRELLRGEHLRQLDQRITARFHLGPLDKKETNEYIRHRLAVAGVERRLFTPGALGRIYQLTGGIPRLINILCDRALLGTYATRGNLVSARIVTQAYRELRGEGASASGRTWRRSLGLAVLGVLIGAGTGWLGHWGVEHWPLGGVLRGWVAGQPMTTEGAAVAPAATAGDSTPTKPQDPGAAAGQGAAPGQPAKGAESVPPRPDAFMSDRRRILTELLARWRVAVAPGVSTDLCVLANNAGLRCRGGRGTWKDLRAQNRPAMIRLRDAAGKIQYGLVSALDDTNVSLTLGGMVGRFPLAEVESLWTGDYLLLWQLPPDRRVLIGASSPPETVRWLRRALADAGVPVGDPQSGAYDTNLVAAVRQFQSQRGLTADGIAGSETLIRLDQVITAPDTPRLSAAQK